MLLFFCLVLHCWMHNALKLSSLNVLFNWNVSIIFSALNHQIMLQFVDQDWFWMCGMHPQQKGLLSAVYNIMANALETDCADITFLSTHLMLNNPNHKYLLSWLLFAEKVQTTTTHSFQKSHFFSSFFVFLNQSFGMKNTESFPCIFWESSWATCSRMRARAS